MKDYLEGHKESGLGVGDRVKILRLAKGFSRGWNDSWPPEMNRNVGRIGTITEDCGDRGFEVTIKGATDMSFCYPYFVLRKPSEIAKVSLGGKRTWKDLTVLGIFMMGLYDRRTYVVQSYTYGRNGNWETLADAMSAAQNDLWRAKAEKFIRWLEKGWVTMRLPRKAV